MQSPPIPFNRSENQIHLRWAFYASVLLIALFIWVYNFEPLSQISEYANDKAIDVLTLIPSLAAAYWCTKLARHFKRAEPPYRIWITFASGWWFWVGGELLGFVYDAIYRYKDYPALTLVDLSWALGYFCFGISLYNQFRLIYFGKERRTSALYLLFVVVAFGLPAVSPSGRVMPGWEPAPPRSLFTSPSCILSSTHCKVARP